MKLIDVETKVVVAEFGTNHSMSVDDVLAFMHYTVDDIDGQVMDENGEYLEAWYDNLLMIW